MTGRAGGRYAVLHGHVTGPGAVGAVGATSHSHRRQRVGVGATWHGSDQNGPPVGERDSSNLCTPEAARDLKAAHAEGLMTDAQLDSAMAALRSSMQANLAARPGIAPALPGVASVGGNLSEPLSPQATPAATPHDAAPPSQGAGTSLLGRPVGTPASVTSVAAAVKRARRPPRPTTPAAKSNHGILFMPGFTRHVVTMRGVLEQV